MRGPATRARVNQELMREAFDFGTYSISHPNI